MTTLPALRPGDALLLATTSAGKQRELRALLEGLPLRLVTPAELGLTLVPEETGTTFAENAAIKARAYHRASGLPTLAEDSGIEVDALGGAPGVYSARWEGLPDGAEKNALLLRRLVGVPEQQRSCRYVCHAVLIDRAGVEHHAEGELRGHVAHEARGAGGFGYDPVFYLPDYRCTVAELPPAEKDRISHRGQAVRALRALIERALDAAPQASGRDRLPQ
ncbi:MAG: RdgB/HAM1 family non-canonical purine NTP pyrophosphatase [Chloroflexi bacterium]|nr:RdgB/HAM1 family non-canonical purine NTP pyrophosphatase [Chloroflexota bacterium]